MEDHTPAILILGLAKQVDEIKELMNTKEFPTIDIEAFLSIVFSCFTSPLTAEDTIVPTVKWLMDNVIENRDIPSESIIQLEKHIIKSMQDIYDALLSDGLLSEQFPYEFKELLPTGGVVLSKIHSS